MDELVNLVSEKTGLSKAQSETAVKTVIEFLKDKLPGPIAGQIDNVLEGDTLSDDLAKGLGGIFGKK